MAILTTYYDYKLQRKAFKLTGERGYARTTDVLTTLESITDTTLSYCTAEISFNVFGDKGESTIAVYDNGVRVPFEYNSTECEVIDWSDQTSAAETLFVKLNYDTEHAVQVKYLGNNKCVGSKSKSLIIFENKPPVAEPTLSMTFGHTDGVYDLSETLSCNVTLELPENPLSDTANQNQTIKFYVDGNLNGTATTNSEGSTTYTFSNVPKGLHSLKAAFEGNQYLYQTETDKQISRGYVIDILSYPTQIINDGLIDVSAQVSDFFNNPIENAMVYVESALGHQIKTGISDSEGIVSIYMAYANYMNDLEQGDNYIYPLRYSIAHSSNEKSKIVTTQDITRVEVVFDEEVIITGKNNIANISGHITRVTTPMEVEITGAVNKTVVSNNKGVFIVNYTGVGDGEHTINAEITGSSDSAIIADYLQYWSREKLVNQEYEVDGSLTTLSQGFELDNYGVLKLGDGYSIGSDFELEFKVVAAINQDSFRAGQWNKNDNTYILVGKEGSFAKDDIIKIKTINRTLKVYKNNEEYMSSLFETIGGEYPPVFQFVGVDRNANSSNRPGALPMINVSKPKLIFTDLKYKVI